MDATDGFGLEAVGYQAHDPAGQEHPGPSDRTGTPCAGHSLPDRVFRLATGPGSMYAALCRCW
jgi:hypothetical protein